MVTLTSFRVYHSSTFSNLRIAVFDIKKSPIAPSLFSKLVPFGALYYVPAFGSDS
jgi:hypothetical protein